jgi:uncharacterized protein YbgA (DUF1722 family)/uncharacterized protein YbbK (DUF523 family)
MKREFVKPNIVISRCIEFDNCRYNSQIIRSDFVNSLKPYVNFIPICPEVEVGLGVPRHPIRIVIENSQRRLIQPSTDKDVTERMKEFCSVFLSNLGPVDGFILKSKSPSCGLKDVKIYAKKEKSAPIKRDKGFFGEAVVEKFENVAYEDETRLNNSIIREHFLKRIFVFASFRDVKYNPSINKLIEFHSNNKFLLMSYNQKQLKFLGNIIASHKKGSLKDIINDYESHLYQAFFKAPRCTSNVNVLQHAFGYFSKHISKKEKDLFLDSINKFINGKISINVPITIIKSWIVRFEENYLKDQTFFDPYPEDLMSVETTDVCSARDYWK